MTINSVQAPDLAEMRASIDKLDRELLVLLTKRARLSIAIGKWKRDSHHPVFAPEREREVMDTRREWNEEVGGVLDAAHVEDIFMTILSASRDLQRENRLNAPRVRYVPPDSGNEKM